MTGLGIVASYAADSGLWWSDWAWLPGLSAAALVWLLRLVERLTYRRDRPTLLAAVAADPSGDGGRRCWSPP